MLKIQITHLITRSFSSRITKKLTQRFSFRVPNLKEEEERGWGRNLYYPKYGCSFYEAQNYSAQTGPPYTRTIHSSDTYEGLRTMNNKKYTPKPPTPYPEYSVHSTQYATENKNSWSKNEILDNWVQRSIDEDDECSNPDEIVVDYDDEFLDMPKKNTDNDTNKKKANTQEIDWYNRED